MTFLVVLLMFLFPIGLSLFFLILMFVVSLWFIPLLLLSLFWVLFSILESFKQTKGDERKVVERWGAYLKTLKPGEGWTIPISDKIRDTLKTSTYTLKIFEKSIKIDFVDGSATPKGGAVFVSIFKPDEEYKVADEAMGFPDLDPSSIDQIVDQEDYSGVYRAIYKVGNWKEAIIDLIENATRSYLNGLAIDEALTAGRAGFDISNHLPGEESNRLRITLLRWGFRLERITITDFDLEAELVKERGEIQVQKAKKKAAENKAMVDGYKVMGQMVGMIAVASGQELSEVQEKVLNDPDLLLKFTEIAERLMIQSISAESGSLTHVMSSGGEGFKNDLMEFIALLKSSGSSGGKLIKK